MSTVRRRLVRGAILMVVAGFGGAAVLAYQVVGSAAVRQQVTNQVGKLFVGGEVALGSAHFRLLGGITVENFTMYRKDDPSRTPLLHVPSGVIYHDKEALAHGRLAVRKLKLDRPRLRISRTFDGRWNLGGILGPVHPELQIPIIEIEEATVLIEIASNEVTTGSPTSPFRVELQHVNATLLNQPLPVLNIQIHGDATGWGDINAKATWHRIESRLDATLDVAPVTVTTALVRELVRVCPKLADQVEHVDGVASLHAGVQFREGANPAWRHQARAELTNGRLVHRDLPVRLDGVTLSARCDDGAVAVTRFTAKAGTADVALTCQFQPMDGPNERCSPECEPRLRTPAPLITTTPTPHPATLIPAALDRVRTLDLSVQHLSVTPELFARLPAAFLKYQQAYAPTGLLDLTMKLDRAAGPATLKAKLRPDGMAGRFESFPYPVHEVRGCLDLTLTGNRPPRLDLDLTAEANGHRPVTIQGRVEGDGPAPEYEITVRGDDIYIDETLLLALPAKFQTVARTYHPQGRCDVTARLARPSGQAVANQQFTVGFRGDAAVQYDLFPVPLKRLTGSLDITLGPKAAASNLVTWLCKFNDVHAAYSGARVMLGGQARPTEDGTRVDLTIRGQNVPLDENLAAAFASPRMKLRAVYEMFRPSGRFDFTAEVIHTDRQLVPAEYDIRVAHTGAVIEPTFFPLELADLTGSFRLTRGRVEVGRYTARHGPSRFDFGGGWVEFGEGWHRADLKSLRAAPLPVDDALVAALPPTLQSVYHGLNPVGTLAVDLDRLVIDHSPELPGPAKPPVVYWDGRMTFADASLHTGVAWTGVTGVIASTGQCRGQILNGVTGRIALDRATVFGQPLAGMQAEAWVLQEHPHELRLRLDRGQLFGGQLLGEAHIAFGAGLQYEVDLKAIGLGLEEAARHNHVGGGAHMSGLAKAELYLTGNGNGINELSGGGNVHVPNGKMYNLPLILDLLKVITSLHAPDGAAFEEAHAEFKIHGKRIEVQRLDLFGSAVSVGGKGAMDLDGANLQMDFFAVWGHIAQLLPPGLREVPPWLSKNLLQVEARGRLGGPMAYQVKPVPMLTDPVRQLVDRARGKTGGIRAQKD
jgi:hypothetical protein